MTISFFMILLPFSVEINCGSFDIAFTHFSQAINAGRPLPAPPSEPLKRNERRTFPSLTDQIDVKRSRVVSQPFFCAN